MRREGMAVVSTAAVLAVLAGGCSSDDDPGDVRTSSSADTASATASPAGTPSARDIPSPSTSVSPAPAATASGQGDEAGITVERFAVRLALPDGWAPVGGPDADRYEGPDGWLEIDGLPFGETVRDACQGLAAHQVEPYGSDPTVEEVEVDGQPGCLVLPSADQPEAMEHQAAAVVRYPSPVTVVTGTGEEPPRETSYDYLALYGPADRISALAAAVRFDR